MEAKVLSTADVGMGCEVSTRLDSHVAASRAVWSKLIEVEKLTVTVIVDNETDGLSTPCTCCDASVDPSTRTPFQSEFTTAVQKVSSGAWPCMDFRQSLLAGHGLSLLLEATTTSGEVRRVLFDGGPRADLWAGNAARLGVDMAGVGAAVLSHWHVDHSDGLVAVAQAASAARSPSPSNEPSSSEAPAAPTADGRSQQPQQGGGDRGDPHGAEAGTSKAGPGEGKTGNAEEEMQAVVEPEPFLFDVHPDRPLRRGLMLSAAAAKVVPFNEDPTLEELLLPGCRVEPRADPHTLLDDCFFVSGPIPRTNDFETGQPGHATLGADGVWKLDPLIMEERYLAVRVRGQGAVVFSGCSHAGIVNVVRHLVAVSQGPVFGIMGGLHLASRFMEGRIPETVAALKQLDPRLVVAGHCTGWRAKVALAAAFPGRFQPCTVGGIYSFLAPADDEADRGQPAQAI